MPRLINFELIGNPINWIIVWLMILTAVFALKLLTSSGPTISAD